MKNRNVKKLDSKLLRSLVTETLFGDMKPTEKAAKDVKEIKPGEEADTLEKHVDMLKALKIEEARLINRVKKIRENKAKLISRMKKLVEGIDPGMELNIEDRFGRSNKK